MGVRKGSSIPIFLQLPATIVIWSLVGYVLIWLLYSIVHRYVPGSSPEFIGLGNFLEMLYDARLHSAVLRTIYYVGIGAFIEVFLGMIIALALVNYIKNDTIRFTLLILFITPMCLAEAVVSIIWLMLVTPEGYINCFLRYMGLPGVGWLSESLALTTLMMIDVWQWTPLPLLLVYAARSSIPVELYETAEIDRLSPFTTFRVVTWPFIRNAVLVSAILRVIFMYITIDKFIMITKGGPGFASEIIGYYVFVQSFSYRNVGYAAALGFLTMIIAAIITYFFWNMLRRRE
ncbi:MAG: sugar ABC transporter permease [Desulfurococcaceae archaeon]|nr:sugar ABC transporter permease [Candidatus Bathyarchaeota archaeon]